MSLERALRVISGLSVLFGIGFAALPQTVLAPYGVTLDGAGMFVGRLFGAANIGFGVAVWLAAGHEPETDRGLALGVIAYSLVEAATTILVISGGVANSLAWGFVLLDAIFIGACALLMRRGLAAAPGRGVLPNL